MAYRLSARDIEEATFSTSLRGYDLDEVDALLERVADTLAKRAGSDHRITADDIERATFSTSLRGYDLDEVDDFLDLVVETLRQYEPGTPRTERDKTRRGRKAAKSGFTRRKPRLPIEARRRSGTDSTGEYKPEPEAPTRKESGTDSSGRPMSSDELLEQAKKWLDR